MHPGSWRVVRGKFKDFVLSALYFSGALWLIAWMRLRGRTVVLTYHRVLPVERQADCYSSRGILVTPETFDWQMRFLRRFLRPLDPAEFARLLRSGQPMPSRSCLVTFDDGWHDNLEFALPVLRGHGVPAVLFVPVDHVGMRCGFWQERLARLLHARRDDRDTLRQIEAISGLSLPDAAALAGLDSVLDIVARVKLRPLQEIETLLNRLERPDGSSTAGGEDRFLDWDELAVIAASGVVTIGSHAMSHRPLTRIPIEETGRELRDSIRILRERLGKAPALLAYPNGDATPEVAAVARAAGFDAAFVTDRGLVAAGSDHYRLRRVNMHESATRTRGAFLGRLLGLT